MKHTLHMKQAFPCKEREYREKRRYRTKRAGKRLELTCTKDIIKRC